MFGHLCIESLNRKLKVETHLSFKFIYIYMVVVVVVMVVVGKRIDHDFFLVVVECRFCGC